MVDMLNFYASALTYVFAIAVQNQGLMFTLPLLSFVTLEMVVFLALCTIGNEVTYQSGKIFQNGYDIIHLSGNKVVSSCGLITGEVANRPVIVSVFGSGYFNLTLDAFIWGAQWLLSSGWPELYIAGIRNLAKSVGVSLKWYHGLELLVWNFARRSCLSVLVSWWSGFVWIAVVKSMASFYVGLKQIEKLNGNYGRS